MELCILAGIVLIAVGFFSEGARARVTLGCGLALVALSSLELSIREHFAGYRSHSALLAGAAAVAADAPLFFFTDLPQPILLGVGVAVFAGSWGLLREAFRRRTGGLSFRA